MHWRQGWSMCTVVYMSPHKFPMQEENICLKVLVVEVQIATPSRFPATVGCFCAAFIS